MVGIEWEELCTQTPCSSPCDAFIRSHRQSKLQNSTDKQRTTLEEEKQVEPHGHYPTFQIAIGKPDWIYTNIGNLATFYANLGQMLYQLQLLISRGIEIGVEAGPTFLTLCHSHDETKLRKLCNELRENEMDYEDLLEDVFVSDGEDDGCYLREWLELGYF